MNREDFIKSIPKPSNEDVILYDISLKDLLDVDVINEYYKLLPIFRKTKQEFLKFKKEIEDYNKIINQAFLYNPSWSKEKYLEELQDSTRLYSDLYGSIKRKEDEIKIFQKKIESINEKIIMQKKVEEEEKNERYRDIEYKIENCKINIKKNEAMLDTYKSVDARIIEETKRIREDLELLNLSRKQLKSGIYVCICCGKKIKTKDSEYVINNIITNIAKNKEQLELLKEKKEKNKTIIKYYKDEISKNKMEIQNDTKFKNNFKSIYVKKSTEILRLEGLKNEYFKKIEEATENLKKQPNINSKKFLELKKKIEKYNLSLENLNEIKKIKKSLYYKMDMYKQKEEKLKEIEKTIHKYLLFLNIYYKIYEQKASQFAGPDYKIKLFTIENYEIINILNIKYKDIEYSQLPQKYKKEVDKNLIQKFSSDF